MTPRRAQIVSVVLALLCSVTVQGGIILFEFDDPTMPAGLTALTDSGYAIDFTTNTGYATLYGQTSQDPGFARLVTSNAYSGDFIALTVARRYALPEPAVLGLAVYFDWPPLAGSPFASIGLSGLGRIESWAYDEQLDGNWSYIFPYKAWFLIERQGKQVTTKIGYGDEFPGLANFITVLQSEQDAFGQPARFGLFLGQGTGYSSGDFDILAVLTADEPPDKIPEPSTMSLLALGLFVLGKIPRRGSAGH